MITARTVTRTRWVRKRRCCPGEILRGFLLFAIAAAYHTIAPGMFDVYPKVPRQLHLLRSHDQISASAQPSARGSLPPHSTPVSGSRRMT